MNGPVERYRKLKADLAQAEAALRDFTDVVWKEVGRDPFIERPCQAIIDIHTSVDAAIGKVVEAREGLLAFGASFAPEAPAEERPSVGLVVDEGVQS